jgi:hypothetical protein
VAALAYALTLMLAFCFVLLGTPPTSALGSPHGPALVDINGLGPGAAEDVLGGRFIFWRGVDGGLYEAKYIVGARWFGPIKILSARTADMASEPSVAISIPGTSGNLYVFSFTSTGNILNKLI